MLVACLITIIYMLEQIGSCLFSPSGAVSVTEVTGSTPIFYPGASVLDGSLEAAGFVSVLWRQRQVDKSQWDVMTTAINN